jgi:hypothetical protein
MGFSNRNVQGKKNEHSQKKQDQKKKKKKWNNKWKKTEKQKMKKTYLKFCWKFDAQNSKVPPTHGKRVGRCHFNHKNKSSTSVWIE